MKSISLSVVIWLLMGIVLADDNKNCFAPVTNANQVNTNKTLQQSIKASVKAKEFNQFDTLCSISAQDKKLKIPDLVLLDVRAKADFDKFRINNSINIPLSQIKVKNFWKSKTLVLINSGHDIKPLIEECGRLRKKGFKKTFVYSNGIASWSKDKGRLIGTYTSKDLKSISPEQLFSDRKVHNWVVIDAVSKKNKKNLDKLLNYFPKSIKHTKVNEAKYPESTRFVFADNAGDDFNLFNQVKQKNKYYLLGGAEGFSDFIFKQYKMTSKQEFTLQKPKSCK